MSEHDRLELQEYCVQVATEAKTASAELTEVTSNT